MPLDAARRCEITADGILCADAFPDPERGFENGATERVKEGLFAGAKKFLAVPVLHGNLRADETSVLFPA